MADLDTGATPIILDAGYYGMGWWFELPSHGRCFFELAVWYAGSH